MYCPKCGTNNQENAQFCENCGSKLTEPKPNEPTVKKKPSNRNILIIVGIVIIIGIGVSAFAFQSLSNQLNTPTSNQSTTPITPQVEATQYSNDLFSVNYPKTWKLNDTQSDSTFTAAYFIDPQFAADPNPMKATGVAVIAFSKSSFTQDQIVTDMTSELKNRVTSAKTTVTVDGVSATQNIIEGDNPGGHKSQAKIITWEKGSKIYAIACIARGSDLGNTLDSQKSYLDTFINSFKSK
ncbi:MAG: PsbP-related protein [Methanobacterium sp.]